MADDFAQRFGGIARLYGSDGLARLRRAHVCVIGVGGDLIEMKMDRVYRNGNALPATEVGGCTAGSTGALQDDCRVYESKIGERDFRKPFTRREFSAEDHFAEAQGHAFVSNHRSGVGRIPPKTPRLDPIIELE